MCMFVCLCVFVCVGCGGESVGLFYTHRCVSHK